MGEFQASTRIDRRLSQMEAAEVGITRMSFYKTEAAEVIIIRRIILHITFEEVPLQPPPPAQTQNTRKHKECGTLEWESFKHPPVSLSQMEAAEVVIIRKFILHITFQEVPL